ncbi:hypothetical protein [Pseudozobellia thermophila]|uniref:DUF4149 domain-containing protein n=1 Tax=Pseudozobellia thermophila TaxID=192903 RepID=A0A1M6I7H4_9FLAO|nr:hypothetical protein [Pseudozobellia thermophila]SHJ30427.1 hypothetical protein SAMN04488513_103362 [Pseudozobellia thermophila]
MKVKLKYPVALASVFLWIGFVGAISFMEAWLKFRAPGVTIPLGLGIGRLVFNALNKVEWVLALAILGNLLWEGGRPFPFKNILFVIPLLLLVLQTFWLLPGLDARAEQLVQGIDPGPSSLHFYYVGLEVVKTVCLFIFGIKLFKR